MKNLFSIFLLFIFYFAFAQERSVFDVARNGTVAEMEEIVKKNPKAVDSVNDMTFSPLILACYRGNVEVAKYLMDRVEDVNYKSEEGTALAALAMNYNKELVLKILEKKADPNLKDGHGFTPFLWAIKSKNLELASILLDYGADKNVKDNQGITAFEHAVTSGNTDVIKFLKSK